MVFEIRSLCLHGASAVYMRPFVFKILVYIPRSTPSSAKDLYTSCRNPAMSDRIGLPTWPRSTEAGNLLL